MVPVAAVAFSPDGKTLAAGGYREILLWDLENAKLARRLGAKQLEGAVQALAFSKEGGLLVAGEGRPDVSGAVRVFDAKTGQLTHSFREPKDVVYSVALSADGRLVAAGAADNATYIWSLADHKLLTTLKEHSDWVRTVAFSPDNKLLATGGADRNLLVWTTGDWKVATRLTQPEAVSAVVFSPDNTNLIWTIGGPESKSLRSRRAVDEPEEQSPQPQKKARPRQPAQTRVTDLGAAAPQGVVCSAEGNRFYVPCSDKTVKIFSGFLDEMASLSGHQDWVYAVALSPDGLRLASGSADGTIRLWSVPDRRPLATLVQLAPGADEWLILTAQGYFTTSTREALRWQTSDPTAKASPLLDQLENTAAVKEALAGKKQEPAAQPAKPASANP